MTGKVSLSSNGVSVFDLCTSCTLRDRVVYFIFVVVVGQVGRFEPELRGLRQLAQPSASQVRQKGLRVHAHGSRRVRTRQDHAHQQPLHDRHLLVFC